MKTKFICVSPISFKAKVEFSEIMNQFHSCRVLNTQEDKILLQSLNKSHNFWISLKNDKNWKIVK
jgi:hypothetical protein